MAYTFKLGPEGGSLLDLANGAGGLTVLGQAPKFSPTRERISYNVPGRDAFRLAYSQETALTVEAALRISGASHDALGTTFESVDAQFEAARDWNLDGRGPASIILQYGLEHATNPIVYDVVDGEFVEMQAGFERLSNVLTTPKLKLWLFPIGRAVTPTTQGPHSFDGTASPGPLWTPSQILGNRRTPTRVRIRNTTAAQTLDFIRIASRTTGNPANFIFPYVPGLLTPDARYTTALSAASPVAQVQLNLRARGQGGVAVAVVFWRSGAGVLYRLTGDAGVAITTTADNLWNAFTRTVMLNPATHLPFTVAELNAGQWVIGNVTTPTGVVVTPQTPTGSNTAITGMTSHIYVEVTAVGDAGETIGSTPVTATPGATQDVLVSWPWVTGAVSYNVYVSTGVADPGDGSRYLWGNTTANQIELGGALPSATATVPVTSPMNEFDLSQLQMVITTLDRTLTATLTTRNPTGDGALTAWTRTGAATNWQALTSGNDTKYLSSVDCTQQASVTYAALTLGADYGVRAHFSPLLVTGLNGIGGSGGQYTLHGVARKATAFPIVAGATYRLRASLGTQYNGGASNAQLVATTDGTNPPTLTMATPAATLTTQIQNALYQGTITAPSDATVLTITTSNVAVGNVGDSFFSNVILTRIDAAAAELVRFTILSNLDDQKGRFNASARMRAAVATFYVNSHFGGADGRQLGSYDTPIAPSTGVTIQPCGPLSLPDQRTAPGLTLSTLIHGIWFDDAAMNSQKAEAWLDMDQVELWPGDENYVELEANVAGHGPAQNQYVVVDGQPNPPIGQLLDTSGHYLSWYDYAGNMVWLRPAAATLLIVRASRSRGNDVLADTYQADLQYSTRYAWIY